MLESMKRLEDLAPVYDDAFQSIQSKLADMRRELSAGVMSQYPNKELLVQYAEELFNDIHPDAVLVNCVLHDKQVTMCSMPPRAVKQVVVKPDESLCALTVGTGEALAIDDIQGGTFLADHAVRSQWGAWASFPIKVAGQDAGSLCALAYEAHPWTLEEEAKIERVATLISQEIDKWAGNTSFEGLK